MEAIKKAVRPLIRNDAYCVPGPSVNAMVTEPNRTFYLIQPPVNYADRLKRVQEFLGPTGLSASQFEDLAQGLLTQLRADPQLAAAASGVCLPIPFGVCSIDDYGTQLETILGVVGRAYENEFPGRRFVNHRVGRLKYDVEVIQATRHDRFLGRLSRRPGVALYLPNLLQGFSVDAQRQQICDLPESMLLSGAIDTTLAMGAYPDMLARDFRTPRLECSAVRYQSGEDSFYFRADDHKLEFDCRANLGSAAGHWSGGLLFLG